MRCRRIGLIGSLLLCGLLLAGCETFDPSDWFNPKKPLPGDRKEMFPGGVPGVPQGVPAELVEGYKPTAEEPTPVAEEKPKPKPVAKPKPPPKPKPAVAAAPAPQQQAQPSQASQPGQSPWPSAAPAQPQQPASPFPDPQRR